MPGPLQSRHSGQDHVNDGHRCLGSSGPAGKGQGRHFQGARRQLGGQDGWGDSDGGNERAGGPGEE